MADYRDLAAALGGGYGQDTGPITPDTLATLRNGKTASAADLLGMLKAIGSGSLSNLESLVRGGVAQIPGTAGDLEGLARMGINKAFGAGGVNVNPTPVLPTTTDILGMMPRKTAARPESAGMEKLGGYMAPAFGKIAKPAVTGYAKLAGQEINAGLTGQPTRSLLGTITPKPLQLDVYHGTPHTLPPTERNPLGEFDASKIGTGEGAQAYGYGIYTAEAPAVAERYKLAGVDTVNLIGRDGNAINISALPQPLQKAIEANVGAPDLFGNAERFLANKTNQSFYSEKYGAQSIDDSVKALKNLNEAGVSVKDSGNLYKVDLPDEKIATMLDWDKPLSQQPKTIQNWLKDSMNPYRAQLGAKDIGGNEPTGSLIYNRLAELMSEGKKSDVFTNAANYGSKNASQELADFGIAGIKYFDEGSRAAGKGTRNFVVFPGEEKNMTILERNAKKSAK
jgi:hypothetical protein